MGYFPPFDFHMHKHCLFDSVETDFDYFCFQNLAFFLRTLISASKNCRVDRNQSPQDFDFFRIKVCRTPFFGVRSSLPFSP